MKSLKQVFSLVLIAIITLGTARAGQVTGTFATPGGSFVQNATVTFTLSQLAVKTDASQTVTPSTVSCYTSIDGSLVGVPNPLSSPVLSSTSGTMTAGTYFEVLTYWNASGETIVSPEQTIVLSSSQGIQTTSPGLQPAAASGYNIYIGITSGGEVLQAHVTGFGTTSIGSLSGGSSPPASNSAPCNIAFNDTFIPAYTTYRVSAIDSTGSPLPGFPQSYYFQGSTSNLNTMYPASGLSARFPQAIVASPVNTTTQSINSNLSLNNHNLLGVGSVTAAGNVTETTGQNQYKAFKINSVFWVDGIKYATLASCYADIPAGGGVCEVPPNYTETLAADLAMTKSNAGFHFNGLANITQGAFRVTMPSGVNNAFIVTPFAHSSNQAGSNLGVSFQGYTGAAGAFDFGDSSGFVNNLKMAGINVGMSSAAANATAFRMTNVEQSAFDDIGCIQGPVSGHACFRSIGTGAFFAGLNRIMSIDCEAPLLATNNQCIELGTISNDNTIIGGHANILGSGANNSTCLLVSGATSGNNNVLGFDCDTGVTAVSVLSTTNGGLKGTVNVDSGVTNIANFGAGSFGNSITTNGNLPYTDNGVAGTNSMVNPARNSFRTDIWQNQVQATFSFFYKDLLDSGLNRLTLVNGAGGDTRLNAGSGAGLIKLAWEQGTGGTDFGNGAGASSGASVSSAGVNTTKGITVSGKGILLSATAPTISSGFGTSPTVPTNNGTAAFNINVGTGGTATNGVIAMNSTATTGWNCSVNNITAAAGHRADNTVQTASATNTVTIENQTKSTGAAIAWTASDIIRLSCSAN